MSTPSIEVISWINDHGGVENLMAKSSHEKQRARWKERKERMKRHIAELERKCAERKLETELLRSRIDEMRPHLMPDGMEWLVEAWPRYEDDAPLKLGDMALIDGDADMVEAVQLWIHGRPVIYGDGGSQQLERGERVKRPAPKVLDADGVEIREGDVLYRKSDGHMVKVAEVYEKTFTDADDYVRPGDGFTHRAPVFAADVRPLHEGEHVYHVETGAELVVKELPKPGEYQAVVVFAPPAGHLTSFDPDQLTHELPDSWERWREEWQWPPVKYCKLILGVEYDHDTQLDEAFDAQGDDLVRRAKALAERGM